MYYVPNKNRCKNASGCPDLFAMWFTKSAITSSMKIGNTEAKTVYNEYKGLSVDEQNMGNKIKHGSGGNSYNNYIMRKKGNILCECNVEKNIHS